MRIIVFLPIIFLITSCGYGSYDECMKEEIKDNEGKYSTYISSYCRDKFPKKSSKGLSPKEYFFKQKEYLNSPQSELSWQAASGKLTITNKTTNKNINAVGYYAKISCDVEVELEWDDYNFIYVNVGPGQKKTYIISTPEGSGCLHTQLKGS